MKRIERVGAIIRILSQHPNKSWSLGYFCDLFDAARSSVSEDIRCAADILKDLQLGRIETTAGAAGGVRYIPWISDEDGGALQQDLCDRLRDPGRILAGGFLYTSDLMFNPAMLKQAGEVFARLFMNCRADFIATIETKGIPIALCTAQALNLPLVVVRRESKISEGSTVSINYISGSAERIQKLSISKRAVTQGSRAVIIDDFMRAGGSVRGITDILAEFDIGVTGIGVMIASVRPEQKKVKNYIPLIYLGEVDEEEKTIDVFPNSLIFSQKAL